MSNFPTQLDEFRNVENLPGTIYKPEDVKTFFAEDFHDHSEAIIATQEKVLSVAEQLTAGKLLNVFDSFSDLPASAEIGDLALVKNKSIDDKPFGDFINEQEYPFIYSRPILNAADFPADDNIYGNLSQGNVSYSIHYYYSAEEMIPVKHIQFTRFVGIGDQMWQVQYLHFWESFDFHFLNKNIHFQPGWQKLAVHLTQDENDELILLSDVIQYDLIDDFTNLKTHGDHNGNMELINKLFSTTPFIRRPAGIYEKTANGWEFRS